MVIDASERGETAVLIAAYVEAADIVESQGRIDEACFYLTQAYVLALDTNDESEDALDARLISHGRNKGGEH